MPAFDYYGRPREGDPLSPENLAADNRQQLLIDVLRNISETPRGIYEAGRSMGGALVDMAKYGGLAMQNVAEQAGPHAAGGLAVESGRVPAPPRPPIDWDIPAEIAQMQEYGSTPEEGQGRNILETFAKGGELAEEAINQIPRGVRSLAMTRAQIASPEGREILQQTPELGELSNEVLGPGATALGYAGLSMLDPENLGPLVGIRAAAPAARAATRQALRAGRTDLPGLHYAAYGPEDLEGVEGTFAPRSPLSIAFAELEKKPKEQRAKGRQMIQILKKYGGKGVESELREMGLLPLLEQDLPVTLADLREDYARHSVKVGVLRKGYGDPAVPKFTPTAAQLEAAAKSNARSEFVYPVNVTYNGETLSTHNSVSEAREAMEAARREKMEEKKAEVRAGLDDPESPYYLDPAVKQRLIDDDDLEWHIRDRAAGEVHYNFDVERDTSEQPVNFDEVMGRWRAAVARDPQAYNLGPRPTLTAPWSQYLIKDPEGRAVGKAYGTVQHLLEREGRLGRGVPEVTPETEAAATTPLAKARIEALRATRADPYQREAAQPWLYTTHYPEPNPLVYTRETTWPKPEGEKTEGTMRMIEELQSDMGQYSRKKGIYDPEAARKEDLEIAEKQSAKAEEFMARISGLLDILTPDEQAEYLGRMGVENLDQVRAELSRLYANRAQDPRSFHRYLTNAVNEAYYSANSAATHTAAAPLTSDVASLSYATGRKEPTRTRPAPFTADTQKYTTLALQQAIADAVQRGDQYLAISPGYAHSPERWGSDELSWWTPDPAQPTKRRIAGGQTRVGNTLRGEEWQTKVDILRKQPRPYSVQGANLYDVDPADPNFEATMENIARAHLGAEMTQYFDPEEYIKERKNKLIKKIQSEEGRWSPRAHGLQDTYDNIILGTLDQILKDAGSTAKVKRNVPTSHGRAMAMVKEDGEWRPHSLDSTSEVERYKQLAQDDPDNYQFRSAQMHYIEIDPALAKAAKRGFRTPF